MRLATRKNRVVRSHGRDRMKFSFPRGAADSSAIRISLKRGADVRTSFTRECAARCCSGRSLKCQPARPLNQMTTSVRVNRRRLPACALANTLDHSPGSMADASGFSTAAKQSGFSLNCCLTPGRVGTWKSGARTIGGHARRLVPCLGERSSEDHDERKRRRADWPPGS
jgi:hypothetical protein